MRDDSSRWLPARGLDREDVKGEGVILSVYQPRRQTLISGSYAAGLQLTGLSGAGGWPDAVTGETYAVRLRRDRLLVVNGEEIADGWQGEAGLAVSDMTFAYAVIDISGAKALGLLRHGAELDLAPSAAVVREFSGYGILLYSRGPEAFRLHIRRSHLDAIWTLLAHLAQS